MRRRGAWPLWMMTCGSLANRKRLRREPNDDGNRRSVERGIEDVKAGRTVDARQVIAERRAGASGR